MINVFLDSDGPIADYDYNLKKSGIPIKEFKLQPGTYLWLPVTRGANAAIENLKKLDDANILKVWVLTKTPSGCPYSYTEKILWYRKYFPWLEDRVILAHDKSLVGTETDFLLDDRPHKANADKFRGTFIKFDVDTPEQCWAAFLSTIKLRLSRNDL